VRRRPAVEICRENKHPPHAKVLIKRLSRR
jgi:hypothetical protein